MKKQYISRTIEVVNAEVRFYHKATASIEKEWFQVPSCYGVKEFCEERFGDDNVFIEIVSQYTTSGVYKMEISHFINSHYTEVF